MNIHIRLKEERERLGLTQAEMARAGNASKASQSSWESGIAFPNARYLELIASTGADVGYILTGRRTGMVQEQAQGYATGSQERTILDLWHALDEEGRRFLQDAARKLKRLRDLEDEVAEMKRAMRGGPS